MKKSSYKPLVFEHQPDALLNQAAPVQNTWYTLFEDTNVKINQIAITVADTGEDLEAQITRDGELDTCVVAVAVVAGAQHRVYLMNYSSGSRTVVSPALETHLAFRNSPFEARSVKIEIRKTTANGVGNLQGSVDWDKMT